jgi:lipoyl(octanoyl) transferase
MIEYLYLGRIGYGEALQLQQELVEARVAGRIGNVLLLLEHPAVITLGRNAHRSNVLASDELLAARGVTLHEINRGGDVTYHGPGQLVGYPIFDLRSLRNDSGARLGPVDFVRRLEEVLIRLCGQFGLQPFRIPGLTGVWCPAGGGLLDERRANAAEELSSGAKAPGDAAGFARGVPPPPPSAMGTAAEVEHSKDHPQGEGKIAAIGVHVSRGVTSHGFAFNVRTHLEDFQLIVPCGIADHPVTSLEREVAEPQELPSLETIANQAARQFGMVFGEQVLAVESLAALRARMAQRFPAGDTPATAPAELERLLGHPEAPERA